MTYVQGNKVYLTDFEEGLQDSMLDIVELSGQDKYTIYINSEGGSAGDCLALLEIMEWHKGLGVQVNTVVLGEAASSGSMVAVAGSKGYRFMGRRSTHMVHYGQTCSHPRTPKQMTREHDNNMDFFNQVITHYNIHSTCDRSYWTNALESDSLYLTAAQSIGLGIADHYL